MDIFQILAGYSTLVELDNGLISKRMNRFSEKWNHNPATARLGFKQELWLVLIKIWQLRYVFCAQFKGSWISKCIFGLVLFLINERYHNPLVANLKWNIFEDCKTTVLLILFGNGTKVKYLLRLSHLYFAFLMLIKLRPLKSYLGRF